MELDNCPGLHEEIENLKCSKLGQSHLVTTLNSPRKHGGEATETGPTNLVTTSNSLRKRGGDATETASTNLEEAARKKKQSHRDLIFHVKSQQNNKEIPPHVSMISDIVENLTRELAESERLKHRPICGKLLK